MPASRPAMEVVYKKFTIFVPMLEVKEVVLTDLSRRGSGNDASSPIRPIFEVYSKDGELLAVNDSAGNFSMEQLNSFSTFWQSNASLSFVEAFNKWKN